MKKSSIWSRHRYAPHALQVNFCSWKTIAFTSMLILSCTPLVAMHSANELCEADKIAIKRCMVSNLALGNKAQQFIQPVGEWILDKTIGNVDVYHKIANCEGSAVVMLKFDNKNTHAVKISWNELYLTKQVTQKIKGSKGSKSLVLPPGETAAKNCEDTMNTACMRFAAQAITSFKADIIGYEYLDLVVNIQ